MKDFEDLKEIIILKLSGDWDELQKTIFAHTNVDKINEKCQEIKQNWTGQETLMSVFA